MSNIIDYYSSFDEWGRLDREPLEFIINLHYIKKYMPSTGKILDNGQDLVNTPWNWLSSDTK
ncbi:hypothetical protein [Paenibacillus etheri]|uniref:hypothetical protein n=1 Tax=Paenibacillus etheri TaxID=1306852 RepID=UPI000AB3D220